jgi:hypothetical protein
MIRGITADHLVKEAAGLIRGTLSRMKRTNPAEVRRTFIKLPMPII